MKLYNTASGQIETLTTDDNTFRMYVCGITPYDTAHLGHAFTYICFDVLARYLEFQGYKTITVQNVTDIDDDILRKAKEAGVAWDELGRRETEKYLHDMDAIYIRRPDHFPAATGEIPRIIEMVTTLLENGKAYEKNGSVYYDTRQDSSFGGHLVDMDYAEMLKTANERGNFPDDANKRDPLDFVLWQAAQPDEPTWESPWGPGRPGWHIECSAMSMHYLGPRLDIHCGGADLIFPHHSCEIVQSEGYSGEKPFVRWWFHIAMVHMENDKMSKSLGNMIFVRDLLKDYNPNVIRIYLLSHHYRQEWSVDDIEAEMAHAMAIANRWQSALSRARTGKETLDISSYQARFEAAMDEDLSTPEAIAVMDSLAKTILEANENEFHLADAQDLIGKMGDVLGLRQPQ